MKVASPQIPFSTSLVDGEVEATVPDVQKVPTTRVSASCVSPTRSAFTLPPSKHKSQVYPEPLSPTDARNTNPIPIDNHACRPQPPPEPLSPIPTEPDVEKDVQTTTEHPPRNEGGLSEAEQLIADQTEHATPQNKTQASEAQQFILESPTYHAGLPWRPLPLPPTSIPRARPSHNAESARRTALRTLQTTNSAEDGWAAYTALSSKPLIKKHKGVYFALLHRLVRLIARQRLTRRRDYMRLLAVLTTLTSFGGTIHRHEWNALINAAGKAGVRRTGVLQYEAALSFYQDMKYGRMPGTTLEMMMQVNDPGEVDITKGHRTEPVEPDLYTYTTLLDIAARTGDARCLRHARVLLERSGIPPNRVTHLALTKYFMATKQPAAVRATWLRLEEQGHELGLDGVNACLVAYSYDNRLDVVMMVYRLLRHNSYPEEHDAQDHLEDIRRQLRQEEYIAVAPNLVANEVTYTSMIQILAYHGQLTAMLTVFVDMITSLNQEKGAPLVRNDNGDLVPTQYQPNIAVFRAIFLGFCRHGLKVPESGITPPHLRAANPPDMPGWTLDNLVKMFDAFMALPQDTHIGPSVFYWIMTAFQKTSGNDVDLMRRVWKQMEGRFNHPRGGPENRLQRLEAFLFPEAQSDKGKAGGGSS
ncbi:hypothetical protein H0H81_009885 [Sphagnurus paluster]|uniref:Uncharacterized protein n=1 Tax=Sphagnurus paluster TaxID=117069 RepID=A0A9P7GX55_9AGAR|nr:hypothetical protein H0H81_009885 [Sphagnurus paluster]